MRGRDQNEGREGVLMTVHDVAEYLRLSEAKVYRMIKAGEIPVLRIGKKTLRFRREMIDEWMRTSTQQDEPMIRPDPLSIVDP